jgi:S1-C subfamily serine protease
MIIPSVIRLIGVAFFLSILATPVHALTPAQVFDKVKNAVVVVKTLDAKGKPKAQGSGVLIPSGKVATNCHVVEGGISYLVGHGNQLVPATLYAEDDDKDICLLDAKGIKGKPAQLGKAAALKVGDPVYAVGAPKGLGTFPFRRNCFTAPGRTTTFDSDHGGHLSRFERRGSL